MRRRCASGSRGGCVGVACTERMVLLKRVRCRRLLLERGGVVLGIARGGPSRSRDELVALTVKAVGEARAAGVRASRVLGLRRCAVWCLASVAPAYVR